MSPAHPESKDSGLPLGMAWSSLPALEEGDTSVIRSGVIRLKRYGDPGKKGDSNHCLQL